MNYIDTFKNGSGIHIKKKNRGKFTDYCGGKVTEECIQRGKHSSNPTTRKRATFAANARHWKHEEGGIISAKNGMDTSRVYYESEEVKPNSTFDDTILTRVNKWNSTKAERTDREEVEDTGWDDLFTDNTSSIPQKVPVNGITDRQKTAMNYLMTKHGFSKEAAAGIVGVFTAESNLTPGVTNKEESSKYGSKAGKGIAQWSNERRAKYEEAMKGKQGLEAELDYFVQDLQSRPLVLDALKTAGSVDDAVRAMHLGYENGSATAMLTPEQMESIYIPAWKKLYGDSKKYSYLNSHNVRLSHANTAYGLV